MFALLAALVLTVPTGEPGALDVVADEMDSDANGNSSLSVSNTEFGDPNQETSDPPPENRSLLGSPPEIIYFYADISTTDTLWVDGTVTDEDLSGMTVRISWLGNDYVVNVDEWGSFSWQIAYDDEEGLISAVAIDSTALESEPWEDLIYP